MLNVTEISIGHHARTRFDEIKSNGTARPIEFPAPVSVKGRKKSTAVPHLFLPPLLAHLMLLHPNVIHNTY